MHILGLIVLALGLQGANAAQDEWLNQKTLATNEVQGVFSTHTLTCFSGIDRGRDSFGVLAKLTLPMKFLRLSGNAIGGWPTSNVTELIGFSSAVYNCSKLSSVIGQNVQITGVQTFHEAYLKRADGGCEKHMVENVKIQIPGGQLNGRATFVANPVDPQFCE